MICKSFRDSLFDQVIHLLQSTFQDLNIDNVEIEMPELFSHPSLETHEGSEEEAMVRLRSCSDVSFTPVRFDINIILINLSSETFVLMIVK